MASRSASQKLEAVFDDETQTVRLVRSTMENEEEGGSTINEKEEHERIAHEVAAAAARGQDTGNRSASTDVEGAADVATEIGGDGAGTLKTRDDEAQASEVVAAASAGGDGMDMDVETMAADVGNNARNNDADGSDDEEDERKMPAVAEPSSTDGSADVDMLAMSAASAMMVDDGDDDGAVEEKKEDSEDTRDDDRKPSAKVKADGKGSPIPAVAAADDAFRKNRLVGDCTKNGRRECGENFRELNTRDPAAAVAAKAATATTPRHGVSSKPTSGGSMRDADNARRDAAGRRLCDVADCPNKARREAGFMCGPHYRELRDRDPAAAEAALKAAAAAPGRRNKPVRSPMEGTPRLEDVCTPDPGGSSQQPEKKKKKKLISSAEVSSLFDGQNGGIELAPRRPKRNTPDEMNAESNGGEMGGRYPARKRARTGQNQSMEGKNDPKAKPSRPITTLTLAAGTAAATRDGKVRKNKKGTILCAVEGCSERSRSESGYMCLAHFRFCNEKGCAPADLEVNGDDDTVIIRRPASRSTAANKSGRGDKSIEQSSSSATAKPPSAKAASGAKLPALSSEIRRTSHRNRCCAVENCSKRATGSKTNWMCKAHFDEFYPSDTDNSKSCGTSSTSTGPAPTPSSAALSSSLVKVAVKIGGKRGDGGTAEAQLLVPLATPKKKKATRAKLDYNELEPLGKPAELPTLPNTEKCQWSFERSSRVLLGKFSLGKDEKMHPTDYEFLTKMMERDDLSVVSEGLANDLNPSLWNLPFIDGLAGEEWCHRVRRFSRQIVPESDLVRDSSATKSTEEGSVSPKYFVTHKEEEKNVSMKLSCFFEYLAKRTACLERIASIREAKGLDPLNPTCPDDRVGRAENDEELFEFTSHDGKECSVNVVDDVLYLIDYDMEKLLPPLHEDFSKTFKAPAFLPGGEECMMNNINTNGRPSMGPNFYVTPPASFTAFHQDGHGTVDSGHVCLSGYNEVVMLRRMPEENKLHAMSILNGDKDSEGSYNTLYGLPHLDGLTQDPKWPTQAAINKCVEMNYCPSVFVLSPGQMVHINKGRLHAFRKLSPFRLPSSDCHADLRAAILEKSENPSIEQTCISVAWDWEFKGATAEGINREMTSTLECSKLNREQNVQSLAVPETSILFMARRHVAEYEQHLSLMSVDHQDDAAQKMLPAVLAFRSGDSDDSTITSIAPFTSSSLEVLRGLLPSLSYIVNRHKTAYKKAKQMEANGDEKRKVSIAPRADTQEVPESAKIDPWSHGDMSCKSCGAEISQCYMHCDGCEKLLSQDFNICLKCHDSRKHEIFYQMCPFNSRRNASVNHVGNMAYDRCIDRGTCVCKNGSKCKICNYCLGCSCRCHKAFTMHLRFMSMKDEEALLQRVVAAVGSNSLPPDATLARLVEEDKGGTDVDD